MKHDVRRIEPTFFRSLFLALVLIAVSHSARSALVINEVDYVQPGTPDAGEFVELVNNGDTTVSLGTYRVALLDESGSQYRFYVLPPRDLGPGKFFVFCTDTDGVDNCAQVIEPSTDAIENGPPGAIALLESTNVVDSLSYGGDVPGYTEGTGSVPDDGSRPALGLSRCPNGVDTNDNSSDFSLQIITPGAENVCSSGPPEPCEAGLTLDDDRIDNTQEDYVSCDILTAGPYSVVTPGDVTFWARDGVRLLSDFSVGPGASFRVVIDPTIQP